jgi:hypothetical protein
VASIKQNQYLVPAGSSANNSYTSAAIDCRTASMISISCKTAGTTSASIVLTVQGSDDVPPNGFNLTSVSSITGQNTWAPDANSWFTLKDTADTALTATITTNTLTNLFAPFIGVQWVRVTIACNTPGGGTIQVIATAKSEF